MFKNLQGLIGLILLFFSILFLFKEESLVLKERSLMKDLTEEVVSIDVDKIEPKNDGKLVYLAGMVWSKNLISDEMFDIKFYDSLALRRVVKVYQWREETEVRGGKVIYKYKKVWNNALIDSDKFRFGSDYINPRKMLFHSKIYMSDAAYLGKFLVPSNIINSIASYELIDVSKFVSNEKYPKDFKIVDGIFFTGDDINSPRIGDIRVEFYAVYPFELSIIGKQKDSQVVPYEYSNESIFLVRKNIMSIEKMFRMIKEEEIFYGVLFNLISLLVMMIGFLVARKPLHNLFVKIPYFWELVTYANKLQFLFISILLSLIITSITWLFYEFWISLTIICLSIGLLIVLRERCKL